MVPSSENIMFLFSLTDQPAGRAELSVSTILTAGSEFFESHKL